MTSTLREMLTNFSVATNGDAAPAPPKCFLVILGTTPKPYRLMFHISQVTPTPLVQRMASYFCTEIFWISSFAFPVLFSFFSLSFTLSLTLILSLELVQYLSSGTHLAILAIRLTTNLHLAQHDLVIHRPPSRCTTVRSYPSPANYRSTPSVSYIARVLA